MLVDEFFGGPTVVVMLGSGHWAAAYYLLGYAIECGLKACSTKRFREYAAPDKTIVNHFYTHCLGKLLNISGVKDTLEKRATADPQFWNNRNSVRDWNEASRYEHATTDAKARDMLIAVKDAASGVLTCS
jgi:hypothetical protein